VNIVGEGTTEQCLPGAKVADAGDFTTGNNVSPSILSNTI